MCELQSYSPDYLTSPSSILLKLSFFSSPPGNNKNRFTKIGSQKSVNKKKFSTEYPTLYHPPTGPTFHQPATSVQFTYILKKGKTGHQMNNLLLGNLCNLTYNLPHCLKTYHNPPPHSPHNLPPYFKTLHPTKAFAIPPYNFIQSNLTTYYPTLQLTIPLYNLPLHLTT